MKTEVPSKNQGESKGQKLVFERYTFDRGRDNWLQKMSRMTCFIKRTADCPGQQRVNFYSFSSLLWGCVVYSCLSCLCLSSTSPAIEPSSPLPPTDPRRKHILPASGSSSPPSSQMERRGEEEMQEWKGMCHVITWVCLCTKWVWYENQRSNRCGSWFLSTVV